MPKLISIKDEPELKKIISWLDREHFMFGTAYAHLFDNALREASELIGK